MADETQQGGPESAGGKSGDDLKPMPQDAEVGVPTATETIPAGDAGEVTAGAPSSPSPAHSPQQVIPEGVVESAAISDSRPAETKQGDQAGTAVNPPVGGTGVGGPGSTPGGARTGGAGGRGRMEGGRPGGQRGGGQRGGGQRGRGGRDQGRESDDAIESSVIRIYRCAKVVKGGRTFSFAALVVAGDRSGKIGMGYGKANEVPSAVEKATKEARASMFDVPMKGSTIPHRVRGKTGASEVVLVPALPGTGVTAGKSVRPCLELAGITDILTKSYGSTSPKNLLKATVDALKQLRTADRVQASRGVDLPKGAGELAPVEA